MNVFLFILFIISTLILLCYYLCFFKKFINYHKAYQSNSFPPVSILICAKNEAKNLEKFLPLIYQQDYPEFEVVLINDRSVDETHDIMRSYKRKYPKQTIITNIPHSKDKRLAQNKKYALTMGIKAARNNHLLFTDADCQPLSKQWVKLMSTQLNKDKQIVLGYGKYQKQKSWLNKLIRYETMQTALQYFSYAIKGIPYMGTGRNLAYTKELFMKNNGFYKHLDVMSGDDDLFVNEVATNTNTAICLKPESFTESIPKSKWSDYIYQKRRHITTAKFYQSKHKKLLGLYSLSLLFFWFTSIYLLISNFLFGWVFTLFILRILVSWYIQYKSARKLQEKDLVLFYPFLEIFLLLFQILIFVINLFKKPSHWTN